MKVTFFSTQSIKCCFKDDKRLSQTPDDALVVDLVDFFDNAASPNFFCCLGVQGKKGLRISRKNPSAENVKTTERTFPNCTVSAIQHHSFEWNEELSVHKLKSRMAFPRSTLQIRAIRAYEESPHVSSEDSIIYLLHFRFDGTLHLQSLLYICTIV